MSGCSNGHVHECVLIDLNTQRDFCLAVGANPVSNRLELIPALRRVVAWIKRNSAPVVSSIGSHRPEEFANERLSACCVDGSVGQAKVDFTVLAENTRVEVDNMLSVPLDLFDSYQQIIFRERSNDLLANPKADRFLTQIPTEEFIILGTAMEVSVRSVVLGLLSRKKNVTVIENACGYWSKAPADLALRLMITKGATVLTVDQLLERKLSRRHRYVTSVRRLAPSNGRSRSGKRPSPTNGNGFRRPHPLYTPFDSQSDGTA